MCQSFLFIAIPKNAVLTYICLAMLDFKYKFVIEYNKQLIYTINKYFINLIIVIL